MALIDAAHNGDRAQLHDLLTQFKTATDSSASLELFVAEQQEEFNQLFKDWKHERSINQRDPFGDTPLHAAAAQGNILMVRYLVSEGADVNAVNNAGSTPLHKAAGVAHVNASSSSSLAVVQFLISEGANPNIKNKSGLLPEDYARLDPALALALIGSAAVSEEVSVPKTKHGVLIGRNGNTREEIQMDCHCTLLIPPQKPDSPEYVKLIGRKDGVEAAKKKINALLAEEAAKDAAAGISQAKGVASGNSALDKKAGATKGKDASKEPEIEGGVTLRYPCHRDKHRFVIGQGGKTISQIRSEAKVRITVPKPEENDDTILLEGTMDNIDKAIKMIQAATAGPAGGKKTGSNGPRGDRPGKPNSDAPKRPSTSTSAGKTPLPQTAAAKRAATSSSSAPMRPSKPSASDNVYSVKPASAKKSGK